MAKKKPTFLVLEDCNTVEDLKNYNNFLDTVSNEEYFKLRHCRLPEDVNLSNIREHEKARCEKVLYLLDNEGGAKLSLTELEIIFHLRYCRIGTETMISQYLRKDYEVFKKSLEFRTFVDNN